MGAVYWLHDFQGLDHPANSWEVRGLLHHRKVVVSRTQNRAEQRVVDQTELRPYNTSRFPRGTLVDHSAGCWRGVSLGIVRTPTGKCVKVRKHRGEITNVFPTQLTPLSPEEDPAWNDGLLSFKKGQEVTHIQQDYGIGVITELVPAVWRLSEPGKPAQIRVQWAHHKTRGNLGTYYDPQMLHRRYTPSGECAGVNERP